MRQRTAQESSQNLEKVGKGVGFMWLTKNAVWKIGKEIFGRRSSDPPVSRNFWGWGFNEWEISSTWQRIYKCKTSVRDGGIIWTPKRK
jgi:hypothetical protein